MDFRTKWDKVNFAHGETEQLSFGNSRAHIKATKVTKKKGAKCGTASGEMKMDQNRRSESGSSSMAFSSKHLLKNLLPSSSL